MLDRLKGKGIIIHHWDADGLSSAHLLLERLYNKNINNKTPELGNYFLTEMELDEYSKYDFVIIVDMSLPEDNILNLAENADVFIFDHHLGKIIKGVYHNNPVIKGENPDDYPSASWIVNDFLGNDVNLFSLLGIVGDHENRIKNNEKFNNIIAKFCKKHNIIFDDMLKMVYLLDTNYKLGDKKAVEEIPNLLFKYKSANDILENIQWNENLKKLNNEIESQIRNPDDEINGIIIKKINTSYNIISTITRKIAWECGKNTIVINEGFFNDKDQLYVRSLKNLECMIKRGKTLGFKCGGKKDVLGAILPKDKTEFFVGELINFFTDNRSDLKYERTKIN